jgi:hypothetical protein
VQPPDPALVEADLDGPAGQQLQEVCHPDEAEGRLNGTDQV